LKLEIGLYKSVVHRLALVGLGISIFIIAGCGNGKVRKQVENPGDKLQPIPARAAAIGISMLWSEKTKNGGIRKVVEARAEEGTINAKEKTSELTTASGILYKDNKPRARFQAPNVRGNEAKHIIIASGGVTVTSIEPAGAILTAQKAIWNANKDTITVEGDVRFRFQRPGDAKPSEAIGPCPRAEFHTELRHYTIWN
jgi:hypothetical protein